MISYSLIENGTMFGKMVNSTPEAFYNVNFEEDRYTYVNDTYRDIWGRNPLECSSARASFVASLHPDDKDWIIDSISEMTQQAAIVEYRIVRPDGTTRWIRDRIFPHLDESGKVSGISGFSEDITSQLNANLTVNYRIKMEYLVKDIAKQLIASPPTDIERVIGHTLETIGCAVQADRSYLFRIDAAADTMSNSHEWCAPGISSQIDALQKLPLSSFNWALQRLERNEVVSIESVRNLPVEAQAEREILEMQNILSILLVPVFVHKTLAGFIGFDAVKEPRAWLAEDIVLLQIVAEVIASAIQRLESEVQHKEQEIRLALALQASHVGLFEYDLTSRKAYVSSDILVAMGYPGDAVITFKPEDQLLIRIHPDDLSSTRKALLDCAEQNTPLDHRFRVATAAGDYRWLRMRGETISHLLTNQTRLVGIIDDITDIQQRANALESMVLERTAKLRKSNEELFRANRLKDEFMASMSHELRTPLGTVINKAEMMRLGIYGAMTLKQVDVLHTLEQSAQHLLNLINDLLDFSRIEMGKIKLDPTYVDIEEVCLYAVSLVEHLLQENSQSLCIDIDPGIPSVFVDERRLIQILVNLLGNAAKFTPEHGKIGIKASLDPTENFVTLTVWDTGIGIAKDAVEQVFQPFVQLDSGLNRNVEGAGLGLALTAKLVALQNGTIEVDSLEGKGSHFHITFPIHPHS